MKPTKHFVQFLCPLLTPVLLGEDVRIGEILGGCEDWGYFVPHSAQSDSASARGRAAAPRELQVCFGWGKHTQHKIPGRFGSCFPTNTEVLMLFQQSSSLHTVSISFVCSKTSSAGAGPNKPLSLWLLGVVMAEPRNHGILWVGKALEGHGVQPLTQHSQGHY